MFTDQSSGPGDLFIGGADSEGDSDDNASNGAAPTSARSPVSQPQTWMVSVPVELRGGGPLSTTRMGRKYTFCSWRLKPDRCVRMPAVLSGLGRGEELRQRMGEGQHATRQKCMNGSIFEGQNVKASSTATAVKF